MTPFTAGLSPPDRSLSLRPLFRMFLDYSDFPWFIHYEIRDIVKSDPILSMSYILEQAELIASLFFFIQMYVPTCIEIHTNMQRFFKLLKGMSVKNELLLCQFKPNKNSEQRKEDGVVSRPEYIIPTQSRTR